MGEQYTELSALLRKIRARWRAMTALRAWSWAAAAAAAVLLLALVAHAIAQPEGRVLVALWAVAALAAAVSLAWIVGPLRRAPGDGQVARFVEECCPELEDTLVTAVAEREQTGPRPLLAAVVGDALHRVRALDPDRVVSRDALRRAAIIAAAATVVLFVLGVFSAGPAGRAARVFALYVFPERLVLEVVPGDVKVRAGQPLQIHARIPGTAGGVVPLLRYGAGKEWREARMEADKDGRAFGFAFEQVEQGFKYTVSAASATSREYNVTVIRPPRVERIDLSYEYPSAFGLKPRIEEDSGDIYGPAGTRVRVSVQTDKPVTSAMLNLVGGAPVTLTPVGDHVEGEIVIADDGSYRVALADADGLSNPGDTEYFIRTLEDRPPDVRVLRPAGDRQVTPIEEVSIEARADDDFGVAAFDLVYSVRGRADKVLPFRRDGSGMTVNGQRTLYLEDLGVEPGDFVTYYARALDVSRGKRSTEARSDIFFLEVKPFEEEFVAAQSQAMGGGGGGDRSLDDLAGAQKEIIVATWKLDARSRNARGQSQDDIRNVARAQGEVQKRAQMAAAELSRSDPRQRRTQRPGGPRTPAEPAANDEPMMKAVEAMGKARQQLDGLKTAEALPHEMAALNELLRAQAEVRRRQVQRQQNAMGGGGGSNRQQQDLSSLFDRELARNQTTNYETPNSAETREEKTDKDDALEKIRELARRQDALNREQQELAKQREQMTAEELKRQLEKLTRDQSELRRQAEELARQIQQGQQQNQQNQQGQQSQSQTQAKGQQSRGQGSQQGQSRGQGQSSSGSQSQQQQQQNTENSRALRQASEEMQNATSDLRRQDPRQASQRGSRALDKLRELEQRIRSAQPDDRHRALGELQLESRQLADAQRQLANEAQRQGQTDARGKQSEAKGKQSEAKGKEGDGRGKPGDASGEQSQSSADARRRRAAEQERLADRTDRLEESIKQLARGAQGIEEEERKALSEASREVERQRLAERMRKVARAARDGSGAEGERKDAGGQEPKGAQTDERAAAREGQEIAKQLERLAERLGTANGQNAEARRLSEQLSRMRELRDKLGDVDRQLSEMRRSGGQRQENQGNRESQRGGDSQQQNGQQSSSQGQQASSGQKGVGDGSRDGQIERPEGQSGREWQQSKELIDQLQREHGIGGTPEMTRFSPGLSAPGTEGWKQDFAKWEELKVQLAAALENAETSLASQLREQESKDRLNAGATQAVPEQYRRLVDQYYRALASKKDKR